MGVLAPSKTERGLKTIYVYVAPAVKERLRRFSFENNINMGDVVESALGHYFAVIGAQKETASDSK